MRPRATTRPQRLLQILEETSDCVLLITRTLVVSQANAAARRMFGEVVGTPGSEPAHLRPRPSACERS